MMRLPKFRGSGMCACSATRSRAGRGSKLRSRATVELRPSAPINVRAEKLSPAAVSIFQLPLLPNAVTVVPSRTSAPTSRARVSRRSSKRLRFTDTSQSSPIGRSTTTLRPSIAMNSTESSLECGKSRTRCATPRCSSTVQHDGFKQSPHTFSRGKFSRSITSVRRPASAQNAAQLDPAGPPPTIATSKVSISWLQRNAQRLTLNSQRLMSAGVRFNTRANWT
jgi:hypothetical protein